MVLSGSSHISAQDIHIPHPHSFDVTRGQHARVPMIENDYFDHKAAAVAQNKSSNVIADLELQCPPYEKRRPQLYWRGGCWGVGDDGRAFGAVIPRARLWSMSLAHKTLMNVTYGVGCHGDVTGIPPDYRERIDLKIRPFIAACK
jgi:hypothetical protein